MKKNKGERKEKESSDDEPYVEDLSAPVPQTETTEPEPELTEE